MTKPTVALQMIVKDELDNVIDIITQAYEYFDELNFTVSDKATSDRLRDLMVKYPKVQVVHRPWNNRFDEARNENLKLCKSDYWFWIDCDDTFDFQAIPTLVEITAGNGYDQILLPYNYAQDDNGECVALHWRERLMRHSHPFTWKGWVHETPITNQPFKAHKVNVAVTHSNENDHTAESLQRNHEILLAATAASDDPRYQLYLGTSFYSLRQYGEAVEILDKFIKVSGNVEDVYRALCCMSECAMKMERPSGAMQYAMQAAAQIPEYPQAYRLLAEWEMDQRNWSEALEWVKVAESKPQPKGFGVFDPSAVDQNRLIAVHCHMMRAEFNAALKWLRKLDPEHPARIDMEESVLEEANVETFIALLPKYRQYFASEEVLFNSLCHDVKYDTRLRGLRELVEKPKTWSDKSIVILVGEGYEDWGPHTLDKGMGGSEEAIIYLSRELVKLGWEVTVYGAVDKELLDSDWSFGDNTIPPIYKPWREINKQDNFNIFVAWRAPDFAEHINAQVKVADIHDVLAKSTMKDYADVTYFVKSQFHRDLYPELSDEKFRIIGNGISKEQFNG